MWTILFSFVHVCVTPTYAFLQRRSDVPKTLLFLHLDFLKVPPMLWRRVKRPLLLLRLSSSSKGRRKVQTMMKKGGGGGGPSYFGPQIQVPLFLSFLFFSLFLLILQVHFLRADRSAFWYVGPPQTLKTFARGRRRDPFMFCRLSKLRNLATQFNGAK